MAQEKLDVIVKAIELYDYTLTTTSNRKKYPAKYRTLIERTQNTCIDIYDNLMEANRQRLDVPEERTDRRKMQTKAITYCDRLNLHIEMAMNHDLISKGTCEFWSKLVCDVKRMAIAWRSKDERR